ncbi:unnamed protein product [Boreogadus saida]
MVVVVVVVVVAVVMAVSATCIWGPKTTGRVSVLELSTNAEWKRTRPHAPQSIDIPHAIEFCTRHEYENSGNSHEGPFMVILLTG